MAVQVIPSYPTHGNRYPSFYKSDHWNDDMPRFSLGQDLVQGTIFQTHSLWDMVIDPKAFHASRRIYQTLKFTHPINPKGLRERFTNERRSRRTTTKGSKGIWGNEHLREAQVLNLLSFQRIRRESLQEWLWTLSISREKMLECSGTLECLF